MPSILVADDEAGVRHFLRTVLEGAGHTVWEASNGKEALALVRGTKIDLVIIDLVMPEQEGFETIRALKATDPGLRIIAMSGDFAESLDTMLRIAQGFGAKAGLEKPMSAATLLEAVQRALDSA
jgi:two-component system chemotaxis response regulator CheY